MPDAISRHLKAEILSRFIFWDARRSFYRCDASASHENPKVSVLCSKAKRREFLQNECEPTKQSEVALESPTATFLIIITG
ncbi:MAG: hypothetical protein EAZ42_00910 [Verrucomicrobia bacterium]|nr:MAG: hypothetical protein EAZ42_00910 [Verrucomicrobiota bacterium]